MNFQLSYACLEGSPTEELMIWNPLSVKIPEILFGTEPADSDGKLECDSGDPIEKFKYLSGESTTKNLVDDYEVGVIEDKILMEISLGMSSNKMVSTRSTTTALDLFGDLGGFH